MFDPRKYGIIVRHCVNEDEFCVTVQELPDVAVYEADLLLAYETVLEVISSLHDSFVEQGKVFPSPMFTT